MEFIDAIYEEGVTDQHVGSLFHHLFSNQFLYDPESKIWFALNEFGIWKKESAEFLTGRRMLSTKVRDHVVADQVVRINGNGKKATAILKTYSGLIKYLGSVKNQDNFCKYVRQLFRSDNVSNRMDTVSKHLFAFDNGVWDLHESEFRIAKPEEMVSTTCGYCFKPPAKVDIDDVYRFIASVFAVADERASVLQMMALQLSGESLVDAIYLFVGAGGNGKSMLLKLIRKCLGTRRYYGTMSSTELIVSGTANKGAASPELAKNKTSRLLVVSELKEGSKLDAAKMKEMTGNDEINARGLYKDTFEYVPQYAIVVVTNFEPEIDGSDEGFARRLRYIQFRSVFRDVPDVSKGEQKTDKSIVEKVDRESWGMAMFHILASIHKELRKNSYEVQTPKLFLEKKQEFMAENNPIELFMKSGKVILTKDLKDRINSQELIKLIINEYGKPITAKRLKTVLTERYGLQHTKGSSGNMCYAGIKLNDKEEKPEDAEIVPELEKIDRPDTTSLEFEGVSYGASVGAIPDQQSTVLVPETTDSDFIDNTSLSFDDEAFKIVFEGDSDNSMLSFDEEDEEGLIDPYMSDGELGEPRKQTAWARKAVKKAKK